MVSNGSSFVNINESQVPIFPNEISPIILAHIDEADEEDGSNEVQSKVNNELYDDNQEYPIDFKPNLTISKNRSESNIHIDRQIDNALNQGIEKKISFDNTENKVKGHISKGENTFESSSFLDGHIVENSFNVSETQGSDKNEPEETNASPFKEDNVFEDIEILASSTVSEDLFSTTTGLFLNSTNSIPGIFH
jgi:hypothetical protein